MAETASPAPISEGVFALCRLREDLASAAMSREVVKRASPYALARADVLSLRR